MLSTVPKNLLLGILLTGLAGGLRAQEETVELRLGETGIVTREQATLRVRVMAPGRLYVRVTGAPAFEIRYSKSGSDETPTVKSRPRDGGSLLVGGNAEAGDEFTIRLTREGEGSLEILALQAPETETTRALAAELGPLAETLLERLENGDRGALPEIARVLDRLLAAPGSSDSRAIQSVLWRFGVALEGYAVPRRRALASLADFHRRYFPADHPQRLSVLNGYGHACHECADPRTGRQAFEDELAGRLEQRPRDEMAIFRARGNLAVMALELGELEQARGRFQDMLRQLEGKVPADDRAYVRTKLLLANTLRELGRLDEALPLHRNVVATWTRTRGAGDSETLGARQNLALTLRWLSRYEESIEVLRSALADARALGPKHATLRAGIQINLGAHLRLSGRAAEALEHETRALEDLEALVPPEHPDVITVRINLAATLNDLGRRREARDRLRRLESDLAKRLSPDDESLLNCRANLACTLYALGEFAEARDVMEAVLARQTRLHPPEHADILRNRTTLAAIDHEEGELVRARAALEEVLAIQLRTLPPNHHDLLSTRRNLGVTLAGLGDFDRAYSFFEAVHAVLGERLPPGSPDLVVAKVNLASALKKIGRHGEALRLLDEVAAADEDPSSYRTGEDHRVASARASVLLELGRAEEAMAILEEIEAALGASRPPHDLDLMGVRTNMTLCLTALGRFDEAQALDARIAETAEAALPPGHESRITARFNHALSLRRRGGDEVNEVALRRLAAELEQAYLGAARGSAPRQVAAMTESHRHALQFLVLGAVQAKSEDLAVRAFQVAETARGIALGAQRVVRLTANAGDPEAADKRRRLGLLASRLARLVDEGAPIATVQEVVERREALERELVLSLSEEADAAGLFEPLSVAALADRLRPDEVAVGIQRCGYGVASKRVSTGALGIYVAFLLKPDGTLETAQLGAAPKIDAAVRRWRRAVIAGGEGARGIEIEAKAGASRAEELAAGRELRRLVVDPLREAAEGRRLIVALDGALHLIPLAALPEEDESVVGDRLEIARVPTLRWFRRSAGRSDRPPRMLAMGGIDYGEPSAGSGSREESFAPLPASEGEARGVARIFGESRPTGDRDGRSAAVLTGNAASRERLLADAPRTTHLHLATHGWFDPSVFARRVESSPAAGEPYRGSTLGERTRTFSPMLACGLALAGAARGPAGLVLAEELAALDLSGCELAVLSACETSVGEGRAGQGIASLQMALHIAGARHTLAACWRVPDGPTRLLMEEFYRGLLERDETPAAALRAAQGRLRSARKDDGTPRYATRDWAAWVIGSHEP